MAARQQRCEMRVFLPLGELPSQANELHLPVALGLLVLAKDITPDYGGRECPCSQSRLRHQPVLPHCPFLTLHLEKW